MLIDPTLLSERSFLFCSAVRPADDLRVISFDAHEEVNQLPWADVVFRCEAHAVPHERELLGQPAALVVDVPDKGPRTFTGIVVSAETLGTHAEGRTSLRARVAPRMWLLGKRRNSRIFQDMTVLDIVALVLGQAAIPFQLRVLGAHLARQYCVQYEETDLAFVTRLLAEEGIFFWFEEPPSIAGEVLAVGEMLVLADTATTYTPLSGGPGLTFRQTLEGAALGVSEDTVTELRAGAAIEPGSVRLSDYDFRRPRLDLTTRVEAFDVLPIGLDLEVYDHHGNFEETDVGSAHAAVFMEQLRARAAVSHGTSVCRRLTAGARVEIGSHEIDRLNGSYVVTRVEHRGLTPESGQAGSRYENRFTCAPALVPVRPPRPRREKQQVVESATVVGPPGQDIYTDGYGRVKVQFPWDRNGRFDEHSSCFLRVMQPWAGDGFGFQFIPRIGMEVLVGFLGGDVDRPVVLGCLYNATHPVPNGLPGLATRSTIRTRSSPVGGGSNELAFEDASGREMLFMHAERDLVEEVGRNSTTAIGADRVAHVRGTSQTTVDGLAEHHVGGDHRISVGGTRTARIEGTDHVEIGASRLVKIRGDVREEVGGSLRTAVDGALRLESIGPSQMLCRAARTTEVAGDDRLIVGGARTTVVSGQLSLSAAGIALGIGSEAKPSSAAASIAGDVAVGASGKLVISIGKGIELKVGKSRVSIGPEEVIIESPKLTIAADALESHSEKSQFSMGETVELRGKSVKISSEGDAILELGEEAKLDGKALKLNSKNSAEAAEAEKREEQAKELDKLEVELFDREGQVIRNAPYEVSFPGYLDTGTAAGGTVEIPQFPDVDVCRVRWGRPKDQREEHAREEEYEFSMDVYLGAPEGEADEDEPARRKLSNLGFHGADLTAAVQSFQLALGKEPTGLLDDVRADLDKHHDDGAPIDGKGTPA